MIRTLDIDDEKDSHKYNVDLNYFIAMKNNPRRIF